MASLGTQTALQIQHGLAPSRFFRNVNVMSSEIKRSMKRSTIKLLGERPKSKFVMVPQALLLDTKLTERARLVGCYLLSLSDGWQVSHRSIARALGWSEGSHKITPAIRNLVSRGWLKVNEYRDDQGRLYKYE